MPFQFACPVCQRTLSVPSRKAGKAINCPRCQAAIQVPPPAVYDRHSGDLAANDASDGIYLPRRALFAQAALLAVTSGLTLLAGFAIGLAVRGNVEVPFIPNRGPMSKLSGNVRYTDPTGKRFADNGALVVALPLTGMQAADFPLAAAELAFYDEAHFAASNAGRSILDAGGGFVRSGAAGDFTLKLQAGNYRLLIVSRHAARAATDRQAGSLQSLNRVFSPANDVVRDRQFRWIIEEIDPSSTPLDIIWDR